MSFPYRISRRDLQASRELKVGHVVRIMAATRDKSNFFPIVGKRPWRTEPKTCTVAANSILEIHFAEPPDSNTTVPPGTAVAITAGVARFGGYSGDLARQLIRQFKYLAFGLAQNVGIFWGREPFPKDANLVANNLNYLFSNQNPLELDRWSYANAMYLRLVLTNATAAATAQSIYLEMVEYDIDSPITLKPGDLYCDLNKDGYLSEPKKFQG